MRTGERRPPGEVEVVADQHRLAHLHAGRQSSGCVGEHDGAGARQDGRADPVHDAGQVVALVGMHPPDEHEHATPGDDNRADLVAVPGDGRRHEAHEVRRLEYGVGLAEPVGCRHPARAEHDHHVMAVHSGPVAERSRCGSCLLVGVHASDASDPDGLAPVWPMTADAAIEPSRPHSRRFMPWLSPKSTPAA